MGEQAGISGPAVRGRLLEREQELASLDALIERTRAGEGQAALVEAPAGMGKTRLIAEARRRAEEAGLAVLSARGGEFEREFAFGVVHQLYGAEAGRAELFAGAAHSARAVFAGLDGAPSEDAAGDASFAVLHGLFWLTVNLSAERPLLIVVDDLHWCDHPSLRFLAYLVRRLEGLPVLVLCGLRPAEPGVDTALLAEIAGDPLTAVVHPGPLSGSAVDELVRERLGEGADEAFAAACHAAAGGNPLLVGELLKALAAEGVRPEAANAGLVADLGPRAASRAVLLRLARLEPEAAALARSLAILGDGVDLARASALAEIGEATASRAVGELVRAEILRPESPLGFVHPLVAAAVYNDVLPGTRELQHERAARLLAEAGAPVEQVAAQLLPTPPRARGWVVETLRTAAAEAMRKGAPDSAGSYLVRALAEPAPPEARPGLLLELGLAEALTSGPAATEHLAEAYEGLRDSQARALAATALVQTLYFVGSPEEAVAAARRARADLPPELAEVGRTLEALELIGVMFSVYGDAPERLARYRSDPPPGGLGAQMIQVVAALDWSYRNGTAEECSATVLEAMADRRLLAAEQGLFSTTASITLAHADREEARDILDAALAEAHQRGSLYTASGIHLWRAFISLRRGELADAEEELVSVFGDVDRWGFGPLIRPYFAAFLSTARLERGNLPGARAALGGSVGVDVPTTGVLFALTSRLELLLAEGDLEEALATYGTIERLFAYVRNPASAPWRALGAEALDRLGRGGEALELARESLEYARRWGAPWGLGRSLRVLGTLEREDGLDRLHEAVDVLDGSLARLEHAKALAALGSALRRGRQPTEAREPLRRALELADACGAAGLAESVRSELYATGARPRTTALQGVEALTASERRVVTLAAGGQTNRDIAQSLFVTPKTIEVHLGNAYRKLGIRSRRELAGALAG